MELCSVHIDFICRKDFVMYRRLVYTSSGALIFLLCFGVLLNTLPAQAASHVATSGLNKWGTAVLSGHTGVTQPQNVSTKTIPAHPSSSKKTQIPSMRWPIELTQVQSLS